ncbi:DnaD domain protein [Streptococcus macacae]|uniref:Uncharacterized protein n=1 Tax=Streptococcus macacae NCTC 11558 TaxID=764298 RepID=G5JUY4_9STRE|nr:DnaD domain protein [Streptococcus macacae]EHJ51571.1 hypothetical protein STRMA_1369 [Streptococcus macacae NCTC 11558]SUN79280.1 putative chromosome replication protein [Streptococcus macacae NCTC 11558]
MKPIDEFSYIRQNFQSPDTVSLIRFYLPIIGNDAASLYQYFISFFDNGEKRHKFSEILNHVQFGMARLEQSLSLLSAMDLIAIYEKTGKYFIKILAPLSGQTFLKNAVYRSLLEQKIGQVAVEHLDLQLPKEAVDRSQQFSDVFTMDSEVRVVSASLGSKTDFDLESFKSLMRRDGLQFSNEQKDVVALYIISEKYHLTWYDTYLLAKETAYKDKIATKRMVSKKEQEGKSIGKLSSFSKEETVVIKEAKADNPELFLAKIKKARHAAITRDERQLLLDLAEMHFLDEVINVMVLYTINKTNSANLNRSYLMKIANDFSYQKVASAEQAVEKMRSFTERRKQEQHHSRKKAKSNIPAWSNQDYKNETTAEEQSRLDEIKRQTLARLRKDDE